VKSGAGAEKFSPGRRSGNSSAQCKTVFEALELRDYGRIDLRERADGEVVFIEANSNCDLKPSALGLMASWAGVKRLLRHREVSGGPQRQEM